MRSSHDYVSITALAFPAGAEEKTGRHFATHKRAIDTNAFPPGMMGLVARMLLRPVVTGIEVVQVTVHSLHDNIVQP